MSAPLIIMALESEGQGRLEALGFEVLYCGIGKVNVAYTLAKRLADVSRPVSRVINLGSAGSHHYHTGAVVGADSFVQRDMDLTGLGFAMGETPFESDPPVIEGAPFFVELEHGRCGTGDSFLQGASPVPCQIVDMEAYALAKICQREAVPFACVKYITDGADEGASTDWQTNLIHAANAFEALLIKHKAQLIAE